MSWEPSTAWWVATGLLVAAELATGTFYLLMLALGAAAAALAAHGGLAVTPQVVVAAIVGAGAVAAWHVGRPRAADGARATSANPDVILDVGERVRVAAWNDDGTARVQYRGAAWNARHAGSSPPQPGDHLIAEVRHNELLLRPVE